MLVWMFVIWEILKFSIADVFISFWQYIYKISKKVYREKSTGIQKANMLSFDVVKFEEGQVVTWLRNGKSGLFKVNEPIFVRSSRLELAFKKLAKFQNRKSSSTPFKARN